MRTKKKLLSLVLALAMVLTLLPTVALAAVAETDVAKIDDTGYATLQAAIDAAGVGEVGTKITLLADVTIDSMITLNKTLTLDLNGHKLSRDTGHSIVQVVGNATLTINGTTTGSEVYGRINLGIATNNNGNAVLNGGTYRCANGDTVLHINGTCHDSDVTISNATITSPDDNGIQLNGAGAFLIENSTITGATAVYIKSGTTTIRNCTLTGNKTPADYSYNGNGANATGDALVVDACNYPGGNPAVNIESGTFTGTKAAIGYYRYNEGTATISVTGGTYSDFSCLDYLTGNANVTVKLGANATKDVVIPAGTTVTLDLNGKTLTNVSGHTITNNGTLTVVDSVGSGVVDNVTHKKAAVYNNGTLTINDGTFTRSAETPYTAGENGTNSWYTLENFGTITEISGGIFRTGDGTPSTLGNFSSLIRNGDGTNNGTIALISGGSFTSAANVIKNEPGSTINAITGGTFTMDNTVNLFYGGNNILQNAGTIGSISGGTFKAVGSGQDLRDGTTYKRHGIYSSGAISELGGSVQLDMSGDNNRGIRVHGSGTINITGGNYSVADTLTTTEDSVSVLFFISESSAATAHINATGGTFSADPTAYVADGYIAKKNSETEYAVIAKSNLTDGVYMSDPTGATAANYYVSGNGPWTVYYVAPYVPPVTPPTTTETTENEDGSTTTTVTDNTTGTVTETTTTEPVTDEAGNTTQTVTETVTNKDGSSVETVTETVTAADGSTTETKTEVKTDADGAATTTEAVTATDTTGTTATTTTTTDAAGETATTVEATVSEQAAAAAAESGDPVTLPVEVPAAASAETAVEVKVEVPAAADEVKVEVPVENVTPGTVVVLVKEDGTEEIVKTTTMGENGVVVSLDGSATVKIVDNSRVFEDVQPVDHWADDAVTYVAAREIFSGTGATIFEPETSMTRAMLMTVLARYEGEDTTGGDTWYEKGMEWAVANGVSDGTNPNDSITREQMAVMLYRYAGSPASDHELTFPDAGNVSDYAVAAMRWAVENGLINGMDGTLNPQGSATRAQVAAIMMRFCESGVK